MDPHFSRASPLDGETRFLLLKNHLKKKWFGVATYFCFILMGKNKIRKKTLNMTPDKKRQVWEKKSLGSEVRLPIGKVQ